LLSQIPLREMHKIAIEKGIPLKKLEELDADVLLGFAVDPVLARRYDHYMKQTGYGGKPIDELFLSHMKWYFRWRIIRVGRTLQTEKAGIQTDEEKKLAVHDARIAKENIHLEEERAQADREREQAHEAYLAAVSEVYRIGPFPENMKRKNETEAAWKKKQDAYYRKKQELAQQPSVGKLAGKLRQYDKEFLADSEQILRTSPGKLTRYQRMIYDAWKEPALTDTEIIVFFDAKAEKPTPETKTGVGCLDDSPFRRMERICQRGQTRSDYHARRSTTLLCNCTGLETRKSVCTE
jgi:hypothetical protein